MTKLLHRQKVLVGILRAFGGHLPNTDFQKYLFLFTQEFEKKPSFDFVPYRFGGFSFQSYADRRRLIDIGILSDDRDIWHLKDRSLAKNDTACEKDLYRFYVKYSVLKGEELIKDVYRRYPYYAIKSEIASQYMNVQERRVIEQERPIADDTCLFTIGYEGISIDAFLNRLIKNNIKVLVDVRRNPISRKYGFSKKSLASIVKSVGIEYEHRFELGIASEKRRHLITQADYDHLFTSYENDIMRNKLKALQDLFTFFCNKKRIALMCFEADSGMCHRGRLAKAMTTLPKWHYTVKHI